MNFAGNVLITQAMHCESRTHFIQTATACT